MLDKMPNVVKKTLIALVSGAVTFAATNLTGVSREWVLSFSLFITAAILIAQFLIEFEDRLTGLIRTLDDHRAAMEALVAKRLSEHGGTVELFGLLERSSVDREIVTEFLRNAVNLDNSSMLLHKFAHLEIGRFSEFLHDLQNGNITYIGEDHDWLLSLTDSTQFTIDATSLSSVDAGSGGFDDGLWASDFGSRYLLCQREAIARNVRIRRVFILENAETSADEAFLKVCRRQVELGVEVRVLRVVDVSPTAGHLTDFILFDNVISYEVTLSSQPLPRSSTPAIDKTRVVRRPKVLKANADRFEALWSAAEPFGESPDQQGVAVKSRLPHARVVESVRRRRAGT